MKFKILLSFMLCTSVLSTVALAKDDHSSALPPGLQKKQHSGKGLPPGWQKKLSRGDVLDKSIYAQGRIVAPLGKDGSISIEVEGTILRLHEKTREILDIFH